MDAVIYGAITEAGNYVAKGFLVGQTRHLASYTDNCKENGYVDTYARISPKTPSYTYGFVERLEMNDKSCRREKTT